MTSAGRVYERQFNIGSTAAAGGVPSSSAEGEPLRVDKLGRDRLRLTWGPSCKSSDSDFVVYEGAVGDYAVYASTACSTGGEPGIELDTPATDRFWLVAPRTAFREGSTGTDGAGAARPEPAPGDRCLERAFDCP